MTDPTASPVLNRQRYADASAAALARRDVPAGHIPGHRWYLMRPAGLPVDVPPPPQAGLALDDPARVDEARYRRLYGAIGGEWLWYERRTWPPERLQTHLDRPDVAVHVLQVDGTDAGMAELALTLQGQPEVAYFGLMPGFTGQGLGAWFLAQALRLAQEKAAKEPIHINTCTHDSPGALILYQKAGFRIVRDQSFTVPDPRLTGVMDRASASHVPLASPDLSGDVDGRP